MKVKQEYMIIWFECKFSRLLYSIIECFSNFLL